MTTKKLKFSEIKNLSLESMDMLNDEDLNNLYFYINDYYQDNEVGTELDMSRFRTFPREEKIKLVHHLLNKNIPGWFSTVSRSIWRVFVFEVFQVPHGLYNIRRNIKDYFMSFFKTTTTEDVQERIRTRYGSKQRHWMKFFALVFQVIVASAHTIKRFSFFAQHANISIFIATFLMTLLANPFTFMVIHTSWTRRQDLIGKVETIYERAWERLKKSEEEEQEVQKREENVSILDNKSRKVKHREVVLLPRRTKHFRANQKGFKSVVRQ